MPGLFDTPASQYLFQAVAPAGKSGSGPPGRVSENRSICNIDSKSPGGSQIVSCIRPCPSKLFNRHHCVNLILRVRFVVPLPAATIWTATKGWGLSQTTVYGRPPTLPREYAPHALHATSLARLF